ncbi:MAG: glutamate synthase large chain, partial [Gaiellaceae bacterium]|nr:glutamate synthase large chain [Gaiellaceae bacterium]
DDLVGRTDLLRPANADRWPWLKDLDLEPLLHRPGAPGPRTRTEQQDHGLAAAADHRWLVAVGAAQHGESVEISDVVRNIDRSVGAMLAGELAAHDLEDDAVVLRLDGTGGQSFGAFAVRGMTLSLSGVVNDYCGKGLSGGRIIVAPAPDASYVAEDNVVCGNVALYGATSGEAFFRGLAGERFCVRNSGATAVVEGVGDHGCEYMTGGVVLVLGPIGRNFAAGMSGGTVYLLRDGLRTDLVNDDSVALVEVEDPDLLAGLLEQHLRLTGSAVAGRLLARPSALAQAFVQVLPHDLRHARAAALDAAAVTA